MAKKRVWPWVAGALVLGWLVGRLPENSEVNAPEPVNVQQTTGQTAPVVSSEPEQTNKQSVTSTPAIIRNPNFKSRTMYVDASRLNVRNGPSKSAKQVWSLKRDERVAVVDEQGSWLRVKGSRYDGWVFGTYLTPQRAPRPTREAPPKAVAARTSLSADKVRDILIERSKAYYRGSCPCPYNRMRNGHRCGRRSAYSRPGGASPLCYPRDVSDQMVADYIARQ